MSRARRRRPSTLSTAGLAAGAAVHGRRALVLGLAALLAVGGGLAWYVGGTGTGAGGGPSGATTPTRAPDILLITLDTTRADRLGSYGYGAAATPHLDRLAREGVRFERALSPVPLTLPAHASLMTSRDPFRHGVRNNGHFVLPDDVPTLAEALAARGYDTAAFVSSFVLDRQFGLARGFGHYDDALDDPVPGQFVSLELERRGDRTVAAARAWLGEAARRDAGRPYFVWVHLYDAHEPYAPPSPFRERFEGRPYDGELAFQDAVVGELLEATGFGGAASPLVVVAGDHGESLGEHGESTHGLFVYDGVLRVPLIVAWPPRVRPATVSTPVRLVDLAPTILDLAGGPGLDGADGLTLRGLLEGRGRADEPAPAYAETYFPEFFMQWAPLRALHAGRWKYIDAPEPELYDLTADPAEQVNLAARELARAATMKRALEGTVGAGRGRLASTPISGEARERLTSLGYLSAAAPQPADAAGHRPDPKRMLPLYERLLEGNRQLGIGAAPRAARLAREVLAQDAGNAFAQLLLGRAALAGGQPSDAIAALTAYLAVVPGSADAHHWMALAHLQLGDRARALAEEEAALVLDPRHTAALGLKAGLLFSSGRRDEALRLLVEASARDAANVSLRLELADLLTDAGRYQEAETAFRAVLDRRPRDARALVGHGLALGALGRPGEALAAFTSAVEADPRHVEARFGRGEVLEQLGRLDEARADFSFVATSAERSDLRRVAAEKLKTLR
jgi:choline-sulfatase